MNREWGRGTRYRGCRSVGTGLWIASVTTLCFEANKGRRVSRRKVEEDVWKKTDLGKGQDEKKAASYSMGAAEANSRTVIGVTKRIKGEMSVQVQGPGSGSGQ